MVGMGSYLAPTHRSPTRTGPCTLNAVRPLAFRGGVARGCPALSAPPLCVLWRTSVLPSRQARRTSRGWGCACGRGGGVLSSSSPRARIGWFRSKLYTYSCSPTRTHADTCSAVFSRIPPYSAVLQPRVLTRCSEDSAQDRLPAPRMVYSSRRTGCPAPTRSTPRSPCRPGRARSGSAPCGCGRGRTTSAPPMALRPARPAPWARSGRRCWRG